MLLQQQHTTIFSDRFPHETSGQLNGVNQFMKPDAVE